MQSASLLDEHQTTIVGKNNNDTQGGHKINAKDDVDGDEDDDEDDEDNVFDCGIIGANNGIVRQMQFGNDVSIHIDNGGDECANESTNTNNSIYTQLVLKPLNSLRRMSKELILDPLLASTNIIQLSTPPSISDSVQSSQYEPTSGSTRLLTLTTTTTTTTNNSIDNDISETSFIEYPKTKQDNSVFYIPYLDTIVPPPPSFRSTKPVEQWIKLELHPLVMFYSQIDHDLSLVNELPVITCEPFVTNSDILAKFIVSIDMLPSQQQHQFDYLKLINCDKLKHKVKAYFNAQQRIFYAK